MDNTLRLNDIAVYIYVNLAKINKIISFVKKKIFIIEDYAHAMETKFKKLTCRNQKFNFNKGIDSI